MAPPPPALQIVTSPNRPSTITRTIMNGSYSDGWLMPDRAPDRRAPAIETMLNDPTR
jgi:hypothetical protein